MKIEIDVDVTAEQDRLTTVLNCKKSELPKVLQAHAKAATMEYVQMFVGRASLKAAADSVLRKEICHKSATTQERLPKLAAVNG